VNWTRESRSLWVCGPLAIRKQVDERSHTHAYEVYNTTQFVEAYATLREAMERAGAVGWRGLEEAS
jgi:hypothetical protein